MAGQPRTLGERPLAGQRQPAGQRAKAAVTHSECCGVLAGFRGARPCWQRPGAPTRDRWWCVGPGGHPFSSSHPDPAERGPGGLCAVSGDPVVLRTCSQDPRRGPGRWAWSSGLGPRLRVLSGVGPHAGCPRSAPDQQPREYSAPPAGEPTPEPARCLASHSGGHLYRPLGCHCATSGQLLSISWSGATWGMRSKEVPGSRAVLEVAGPGASDPPAFTGTPGKASLAASGTACRSHGSRGSSGHTLVVWGARPSPPTRLVVGRPEAGGLVVWKEHAGAGRWQHLCGDGWRPESGAKTGAGRRACAGAECDQSSEGG